MIKRCTKIDWLCYTDKYHDISEVCELWFPYFGEPVSAQGFYGYNDRFCGNGINVHFNGGAERGILVEISGTGTNLLYQQGFMLEEFIAKEITQHEYYHVTRIDLAHDYFADDEADFFPFDSMIDAVNELRFVSNIHKNGRSVQIVSAPRAFDTYGIPTATVYLGAAQSATRLRVYNKLGEQTSKCKGNPLLPDVFDGRELKQWIRFEFQLRDLSATALTILQSVYSLNDVFIGIIRRYIRFVDRVTTNVTESPVCDWWSAFLQLSDVQNLFISRTLGDVSLKSMTRYVKAASSALYTFVQVYGIDALYQLIEEAKTSLPTKYRVLIPTKPHNLCLIGV